MVETIEERVAALEVRVSQLTAAGVFREKHPYTVGSALKQIFDRVEAAYPSPKHEPYKKRR